MDQLNEFNARNDKERMFGSEEKDGAKQMGIEEKKGVVKEELRRMRQLPSNSSYVVHRSRVLNKIMQLLSIERTTSQEEELGLLFAGLSLSTH